MEVVIFYVICATLRPCDYVINPQMADLRMNPTGHTMLFASQQHILVLRSIVLEYWPQIRAMWYVNVVYNVMEQPLCFDGPVDNEIRRLFGYVDTYLVAVRHIRSNARSFCVGYPVHSFATGFKA
ncbi:MAG: hypothetical protein OXD43_09175 [Bacteroidetes bacterium]|nr:hypothetical protein [Bacteroidota bacterium]